MSGIVSGPVRFGLVPSEHWNQPDWIDEEKAAEGRRKLVAANVIYGGKVSPDGMFLWCDELIAVLRQRIVRE